MKLARDPPSSCRRPWTSLKKKLKYCLNIAPCWLSQQENRLWSEISSPLRNPRIGAFESRAHGFSTPLTRRRSSCPPPSPDLALTDLIERYCALPGCLRQCPLPHACHSPPGGHQVGGMVIRYLFSLVMTPTVTIGDYHQYFLQ